MDELEVTNRVEEGLDEVKQGCRVLVSVKSGSGFSALHRWHFVYDPGL
jgi:hypothetical protein